MIFKYGSYSHQIAEIGLVATQILHFDDKGEPAFHRYRWTIRGQIFGTDPSDLTTKLAAMEASYTQNENAGLYEDDGTTPTHHVVAASSTLGGVRVLGIEYPRDGIGSAEYSTFVTYVITIEFDIAAAGVNPVTSWVESLEFFGGGPDKRLLTLIQGAPVEQETAEQTPTGVIQAGEAVGYSSYPTYPASLWPTHYRKNESRQRKTSPRLQKAGDATAFYTDYKISWFYMHRGTADFTGNPNAPT